MFAIRSPGILKPRYRFGFVKFILIAVGAQRQRRQLKKLDNISLRDIGLTREEAIKEAARPIWDVPQNWLK